MRVATAVLLMVLVVACGDSSPTSPVSEVVGEYTLQSIDGDPVPTKIIESGQTYLEVESGLLDLRESGRAFLEIVTNSTNQDGGVDHEIIDQFGTWVKIGQEISLVWNDCTELGTLVGDVFTLTDCFLGLQWVFWR